MTFQDDKFDVKRYDLSEDKSLKAWSAADEFLLKSFDGLTIKPKNTGIYNDRFGFLACHLNSIAPTIILTHKSQEKALDANIKANGLTSSKVANPLAPLDDKIDLALLKTPKSTGLFQFFLEHISHNSSDDIIVICSFMTRHFSPKLLKIAQEYFEVVEQSKAHKKARTLTLTNKKKITNKKLVKTLTYNNEEFKQYLGVFSADHIDYATQFFLDHIDLKNSELQVLDLASGNGIIGKKISEKLPEAEIHLMDDSFLAVESAKLNIDGEHIHHYFDNDLSGFQDQTFDLIATNPPFHFEHEINIQIPIALFKECHRCLKIGGNLQVVASRHLNFKTHLSTIFSSIEVIAEDKKFIVYKSVK